MSLLLYDNVEDVYKSRTFCLYKDIEQIKKVGLAKGGSLENAIVVKSDEHYLRYLDFIIFAQ